MKMRLSQPLPGGKGCENSVSDVTPSCMDEEARPTTPMVKVMPSVMREKGAIQERDAVEFRKPMLRLLTADSVPEKKKS